MNMESIIFTKKRQRKKKKKRVGKRNKYQVHITRAIYPTSKEKLLFSFVMGKGWLKNQKRKIYNESPPMLVTPFAAVLHSVHLGQNESPPCHIY